VKIDKGNFRVDLRLLLELGERLISRDEIAVVELVKNAYDADARNLKVIMEKNIIEIKDDGEGMERNELIEGWLTVGTALKRRETRTKHGRRVLGEKGLGRLAVLRLGKKITLYTKKKGKPCYQITMDWEEARKELDENIYKPIGDMTVDFEIIEKEIFPEGHGTSIIIKKLNNIWDENKIERLKIFLSRLVEPQKEKRDIFNILFFTDGKKIEIRPPEITRKPHYFMEIDVNEDGTFSGIFRWSMERSKGEDGIEKRTIRELKTPDGETLEWKNISNGGCGGFKFRLSVWDLDSRELRGYKNILKQWSGISLLRDGFRVVQPDVDWLGLDLRRVQNPTLRLSTNKIIGSVFISSDENPHLIDKTDREGIIENESLSIMKSAIYHFMNILELKRYSLRRRKALSRGVIFNYLDTSPLRYAAKKLPAKKKEEIEKYASQIDNFRNMLEEWILGRDRMATMGLLGARLIHEARSALMKITDNYPMIEKYMDNLDSKLFDRIKRMVSGGKMLASIFRELDPFLKFRGKRRQDIVLKKALESIEFLFQPDLDKSSIKVKNKIPKNMVFRANPTDIYVLIANFLDNGIYWLKNEKNKEKIIEFRAKEEKGFIKIEIADNGPGINVDNINDIYDAGFTTKPDGTGLGLSIVRDVVEYYGGNMDAGEDKNLKGALFQISLPFKEGKK